MRIDFNSASPQKLARFGISVNFDRPKIFNAAFEIEPPISVHSSIATDLPFRMGAFSASFGGRLRYLNIGRYCSLAGDIQTGWDEHPIDQITSSMVGYVKNIHGWASFLGHDDFVPPKTFKTMRGLTTIENDVWIGHGAFLQAGVKIGTGAIVGARSLVTKDVPPYAIVVGTPARIVRYRFTDAVIEKLLSLSWWRYSIFDLPATLISSPIDFCSHLEERIQTGTIETYSPKWLTANDLQEISSRQ